jgi:hypothetical protein
VETSSERGCNWFAMLSSSTTCQNAWSFFFLQLQVPRVNRRLTSPTSLDYLRPLLSTSLIDLALHFGTWRIL